VKPLITIILLLFIIKTNQDSNLDNWIQSFVNDMIEMNDLDRYSEKPISPTIEENFILVESVKDIEIEKDTITMLVNHGKGTYCTKLKFRFLKKEGNYYLVFPKPYKKNILGKEQDFVNPWIEKTNICN